MPDTFPGPPERTGAGKRTNLGGANEAATKVTGSKSSPSALPDSPTEIVTRSGFCFSVRPVTAADQGGLAELMAAVSEDDIRFRFVTAGERTLERMSRVDHDRTENCVAIDGSMKMVATAMLASGASGKEAEVAVAVRADCRHQGIGWMLLDYVVHYAARHGLSSLGQRKAATIGPSSISNARLVSLRLPIPATRRAFCLPNRLPREVYRAFRTKGQFP